MSRRAHPPDGHDRLAQGGCGPSSARNDPTRSAAALRRRPRGADHRVRRQRHRWAATGPRAAPLTPGAGQWPDPRRQGRRPDQPAPGTFRRQPQPSPRSAFVRGPGSRGRHRGARGRACATHEASDAVVGGRDVQRRQDVPQPEQGGGDQQHPPRRGVSRQHPPEHRAERDLLEQDRAEGDDHEGRDERAVQAEVIARVQEGGAGQRHDDPDEVHDGHEGHGADRAEPGGLLSTCSARFTVASAATTIPVAATACRAWGPWTTRGAGRFDVRGRRRRNRSPAMSPDVETAVGVGTRRGTFSVGEIVLWHAPRWWQRDTQRARRGQRLAPART